MICFEYMYIVHNVSPSMMMYVLFIRHAKEETFPEIRLRPSLNIVEKFYETLMGRDMKLTQHLLDVFERNGTIRGVLGAARRQAAPVISVVRAGLSRNRFAISPHSKVCKSRLWYS
jgi:hypothetical protein